jgi:DNA-binding CsgD family transcriptional regulator
LGLQLIQFPVSDDRSSPLQQQILDLRHRIDRLTAERDEVRDTLDRLALGIIILDRTMCVTFANASARSILADADGAAGQQLGRFFARDPRDQRRLRELVRNALQARCISREPRQAGMIMHGADGSQLLSVCVISASPPFSTPSNDKVALALRRLETAPNLSHCMQLMFSLTETETKYAMALVSGLSLAEEAQAQGVRISTARTHLARLFQKTHTHQQSQLVARLSAAAPAF